jgi:hypothetical protein
VPLDSAAAPPISRPSPAALGGPAVHVALFLVQVAFGALVFVPAHLALRTPRVRAWRDMLELALLALFGIVLDRRSASSRSS